MFRNYLYIFFILHCDFIDCWSFTNWWRGTCLPMEAHVIIDSFERNLTENVFGQHLVTNTLVSAIYSHLTHEPKKALVLSFHGPAGVGKTLISFKIAHHIFNGDPSYVKFYSGRNDFVGSEDISKHMEKLAKDVKTTVEECPYSIFIFDEANFLQGGLFDVLRPFTDYMNQYQGVDYRKSIFIFLSNIGQSKIAKIYHDQVKGPSRSKKREELTLSDFEDFLSGDAYNDAGGLKGSSLITNFLIDYYIPFLPLEDYHVKKCISQQLRDRGIHPQSDILMQIYNRLPKMKFEQIEYTASNCKRVSSEVGRLVASQERTLSMKNDEF